MENQKITPAERAIGDMDFFKLQEMSRLSRAEKFSALFDRAYDPTAFKNVDFGTWYPLVDSDKNFIGFACAETPETVEIYYRSGASFVAKTEKSSWSVVNNEYAQY